VERLRRRRQSGPRGDGGGVAEGLWARAPAACLKAGAQQRREFKLLCSELLGCLDGGVGYGVSATAPSRTEEVSSQPTGGKVCKVVPAM